MRKILLSIFTLTSAFAAKAQFVNGDFESTFTNPIPTFTNVTFSPGWSMGGSFYSIETIGAYAGKQSLKLETVEDPLLFAAANKAPYNAGLKTDTISSFVSQMVKGTISNPDQQSINFAIKCEIQKDDTAAILVQIKDTLAKGINDDVTLYQFFIYANQNISNWTPQTFKLGKVYSSGNYTANALFFYASSSIKRLFGRGQGMPGTKMWLDDIKLTSPSSAGLEEKFLDLTVYPNPANEVLNIKLDEEIHSVMLTSVDGKVVYTGKESSINTSALRSGLYVYEVTSVTGKVAVGNFIKE